ncbi:type I DNA topoisomerase [Acetobacteraceae bacterium]|nr:type I DNA topoisomerase [Acetobacteraceae bacterium]
MVKLVVVESPAKAKTINRYLGSDYKVIASFGHVRDLPSKDGSVLPDKNFAMKWEIDKRGARQMGDIEKALKGASRLILATDPDREGEAISWHIKEILQEKKKIKDIPVERVTFNEITKNAIKTAMESPRGLDQPLIDAYLARRALDYLVGFNLSPVLWRKLPGSRSAGRVQSVALRLICERESEIEVFNPREYWSVISLCQTEASKNFEARLTHFEGKKLDVYDIENETQALKAVEAIKATSLSVASVEKKRIKRNPPPPFTTSTMQQDASRKLGMAPQHAMRIAQQLYEGITYKGEQTGLITYMRTDGVTMSKEAVFAIRDHIKSDLGEKYLPNSPRMYKTKTKNAQEAHEAIRPTDITHTPQEVAPYLDHDQARLYELIWKRATASQMASAEIDQTTATIQNRQKDLEIRATGSVIAFDGFMKITGVPNAKKEENSEDTILPEMKEGETIQALEVTPNQHFTQPPPRYSEASLVKKMEEIGIGRPSTYASILAVLKDREYVRLESRRFFPEDRGRLVTAFLVSFFNQYVETDFTANLEEELDNISDGRLEWHKVMENFWTGFSDAVGKTENLKISDVIDALDEDLGPHFFPQDENHPEPRKCPICEKEKREEGRLGLRLGRHGAFIGCSNYPECAYTRPLISGEDIPADMAGNGRILGKNPETKAEITLKKGPYGFYVQEGEVDETDKKKKPKRSSLPKAMDPETLTLETALDLLALPRFLGNHPDTGEKIEVNLGRFGPYVKMGSIFGTLTKEDDLLSIQLPRALEILAAKLASIRNLGPHPKDGEAVLAKKGRFGPYAQHAKMMAPLPKGTELDDVTLDMALEALAEKGKPVRGTKKATAKKASAKKSTTDKSATKATKKIPAKKASVKKTTAKKTTVKKASTTKKKTPKKEE